MSLCTHARTHACTRRVVLKSTAQRTPAQAKKTMRAYKCTHARTHARTRESYTDLFGYEKRLVKIYCASAAAAAPVDSALGPKILMDVVCPQHLLSLTFSNPNVDIGPKEGGGERVLWPTLLIHVYSVCVIVAVASEALFSLSIPLFTHTHTHTCTTLGSIFGGLPRSRSRSLPSTATYSTPRAGKPLTTRWVWENPRVRTHLHTHTHTPSLAVSLARDKCTTVQKQQRQRSDGDRPQEGHQTDAGRRGVRQHHRDPSVSQCHVCHLRGREREDNIITQKENNRQHTNKAWTARQKRGESARKIAFHSSMVLAFHCH